MLKNKIDRIIEEVLKIESRRIKDIDYIVNIDVPDFSETMKKLRKRLELDSNSQKPEVMSEKENYK